MKIRLADSGTRYAFVKCPNCNLQSKDELPVNKFFNDEKYLTCDNCGLVFGPTKKDREAYGLLGQD